jgi:hypothetical protein
LSWHLIHESMSSVHLASSCYLLRCFLKSYGILGSLQGKEQKTRPCGPVALWPCLHGNEAARQASAHTLQESLVKLRSQHSYCMLS